MMDIFGNFSKLKGDKEKRRLLTKEELDFSLSDTIETIGKIESKEVIRSTFNLKSIVVVIFCVFVFRLFFLQVIHGADNTSLAEGNRTRPRAIEANRGLVSDKNGAWLARNQPDFALAVYPSDLPRKSSGRQELYAKLSILTGLSADEIKEEAEKNGLLSRDKAIIKDNVSHDEALLLEERIIGLPGVFVSTQSVREYLVLPGLAHILGYTAKVDQADVDKNPLYHSSDRIGKSGLEKHYEEYLRGTNGLEQIEVNSKNMITRVLIDEDNKQPIPGNNLSLYLDKELQAKCGEALKNGMESAKQMTGDQDINSGVVMVMDVQNGGILANVSLPDYDNNLFVTKISNADYQRLINDVSNPMFNRAIQGNYPPGSISKIILASAGLMEKNITTNIAFDTPPAITIGEYSFPDWKDHGMTDIKRAIAESNNIFFYSIGGGFDKIKGLGMNLILKWWKLFGLGEKTGIDLPGESAGFLPTPEWKKEKKKEPWYIGDTYHVSIGQGDLLVTPIQMLRTTAAIANGGKLLQPQIVHKIMDNTGKLLKEFSPRVERENFIDSGVIRTIQEGMRMTITDGSARNLNDLTISVAGKTGTAQFLNNEKTHAWFTAYAPYENPQIAIIVFVDGGGGGHEIAGPIAKDVLNYYFTR